MCSLRLVILCQWGHGCMSRAPASIEGGRARRRMNPRGPLRLLQFESSIQLSSCSRRSPTVALKCQNLKTLPTTVPV